MEKGKTGSAKKITDTVKKIVGMGPVKPVAGKKETKRGGISEELSRRIQDKAYELYQNRGYSHGDDQADWYQAEQIVMAEMNRR